MELSMGSIHRFSGEGDDEKQPRKLSKLSRDPQEAEPMEMDVDMDMEQSQQPEAVMERDPRWLVTQDVSISVLLRLSRAEYGSVALLNKNFYSLIQSGELYKVRRKMGVVEHWVYFACDLIKWQVYDPINGRWMKLPIMPVIPRGCFMCSNKESLAVGTELLVFGRDIAAPIVYSYGLLNNTWSLGNQMSVPRCLFASASCGEKAIVAGGCTMLGQILSVAELYNSETKTWETLPDMNKARKSCSGVFMDGKFYAIGGLGVDRRRLTCAEEFDFETKEWRVVPNMLPARSDDESPIHVESPPLVAVVKNVLYGVDCDQRVIRRYDKNRNSWVSMGRLPDRASSINGWGLAFHACGDRLVVIGGENAPGRNMVEINSWIPEEGTAPQWNLLARKQLPSFVYNCTVMGC